MDTTGCRVRPVSYTHLTVVNELLCWGLVKLGKKYRILQKLNGKTEEEPKESDEGEKYKKLGIK